MADLRDVALIPQVRRYLESCPLVPVTDADGDRHQVILLPAAEAATLIGLLQRLEGTSMTLDPVKP